MTLPISEALGGKYEILDKIGEGGMGSVYKVRHRLLEEIRVIKVLRPHAAKMEDLQRRFLREAKMAIRLKHPNIAQLHDFSIAGDGTAYIVMEYIDGIGLDAMIRTAEPPSLDLALELAAQALAALDYLHEQQFVHRDVSPDNLMLTSSFDGSPLVKLIDLGIAKNLDAEAQLTQTGVFLGKVRYCSPEQFSGKQGEEQVLDRGSDIYSFGVLLYEMLTGNYPFNGESFAELAGSHLFQPPHEFEQTDPDNRIPQGLRDIVLKALAKDRDGRFATAAEFADQLGAFRNPEAVLKDEFDRAVEVTTSALSKGGAYDKPGSTQGRLDREFGLETTAAPPNLTAVKSIPKPQAAIDIDRPMARIQKLLAAGKLAKAEKHLAKAVEEHGPAAHLANLREQLEGAKKAAATGGTPTAGLVTPARIAAAVVALALIATAAFVWDLSSRGGSSDVEAPDQLADALSDSPTQSFAPTERWSARRPGAAEIDLEAPELTDPPPLEDEIDSGTAPKVEIVESPEPPPVAGPARQEPSATPSTTPAVETEPKETVPASPPAGRAELLRPDIGVVAPVLLDLPDAQVPADARAPKEEVVYMVRVLVDEFGDVASAEVVSGPAFKRRLKDAAAEAAGKATFRPASKDGVVGRMWTEVRIVFSPQ